MITQREHSTECKFFNKVCTEKGHHKEKKGGSINENKNAESVQSKECVRGDPCEVLFLALPCLAFPTMSISEPTTTIDIDSSSSSNKYTRVHDTGH